MHKSKNIVSVNRPLLSARFLLSVLILILAAAGLRPGMQALSKHYQKESIATRRPLKEFDISCLPSFRNGWVSSNVPPEDIGTDEYLIIKLSRKKAGKESQQVALFVTYYSNPGDKVPHEPNVCYRQGGAIVKKMKTIIIDTPELAPEYPQTQVTLLIFQMPRCEQVVIYCFCAEGELQLRRRQVRWLIGKPGNRYTYFSKIEVVANYPTGDDPTQTIETCKTLIGETLPILLTEYFPDRQQLKRR